VAFWRQGKTATANRCMLPHRHGFFSGAGGKLKERFAAISGDINSSLDQSAYVSYEETPGPDNDKPERYAALSDPWCRSTQLHDLFGRWKEVHNSYLQIGVEGGIPALGLYLLFFWSGFSNLRRLRKKLIGPPGKKDAPTVKPTSELCRAPTNNIICGSKSRFFLRRLKLLNPLQKKRR